MKIEFDMLDLKKSFVEFYLNEMGRGRISNNHAKTAWRRFVGHIDRKKYPELNMHKEDFVDGQTK